MKAVPEKLNVFWFRRDLRLHDNHGLFRALSSNNPVIPVFIFDTDILDELEDKKDKRIEFIHHALSEIQKELVSLRSSLFTFHSNPLESFKQIIEKFNIEEVYTNNDYEPYALKRDNTITEFLKTKGIKFNTFKDQVIFEKNEITKNDGSPYTVYTPYNKKCKLSLNENDYTPHNTKRHSGNFYKTSSYTLPGIEELGFKKSGMHFPPKKFTKDSLKKYHLTRDYPALNGTSSLSVHLRFGTVSIRELVKEAVKVNEKWLDELIWREFFMMILYNFPHVVTSSFRTEYDKIKWRNNEIEFKAWREGKTGFPIVDAGMRELNETGFMHNRVRMITAGFLTKHLLIDWRLGESYFASKLLDYELASNNGNWQWAAGSGCDAAPYFRVFNPEIQTKKFDPELKYIKKWVTELNTPDYPKPIVEHSFARNRALETYNKSLRKY